LIEAVENYPSQALLDSKEDSSISKEENLTISGSQRQLLMQKLLRQNEQASRCLLLKNMVEPQDVDEDLETEITSEVAKYGLIEKVVIFQEKASVVKIFILFQTSTDSTKAMNMLNGRFFGGRKIQALYYDETAFIRKDFTK